LFVVLAGMIGPASGKVLAFRSRNSALGRTRMGDQRGRGLVNSALTAGGVYIEAVRVAAQSKLTRR
jgi:hypothetical protein